jgi:sialic acid synthase SpsE
MKPYIIAEAGINHNGDVDVAGKLIDVAVDAGADAVKFQTFWDIHRLKKYELTPEEFRFLHKYCQIKKIEFMSTPHTFEAIHFLNELVSTYKVASTYLTNANFLREVADKGKPILLSTGSLVHDNGMATDEEIVNALSFIPDANVTLMHCISKYPCRQVNFKRAFELEKFHKTVGISDHSKRIRPYYAPIIEKHFRLNDIDGPDTSVSLLPEELKKFVKGVKK